MKIQENRIYSSFRDNIWGVDLLYLLCAIDIFSKYAWAFPLKDKRGVSIVNAFQEIISEEEN